VWIGDQEADFEAEDGLPTVVPALLNLGLSGIPYVTHDIAGYSGGPSSRELFFRWVELGAFTPIFRTHEGLNAAENWHWDRDAETTAHFGRFARIHAALAPEIEALADEAATTSMPLLRHLAMVFGDDVASRSVSDEFMLGDALLLGGARADQRQERGLFRSHPRQRELSQAQASVPRVAREACDDLTVLLEGLASEARQVRSKVRRPLRLAARQQTPREHAVEGRAHPKLCEHGKDRGGHAGQVSVLREGGLG